MKKISYYNDLIGQFITSIKDNESYVYFITDGGYTIRIPKFVPYCACNVGEYIDEITTDGTCFGAITNIDTNVLGSYDDGWYDEENEIVYKGNVTFFFENGKINMNVHGEDNGYYGVRFTMPAEIIKEN